MNPTCLIIILFISSFLNFSLIHAQQSLHVQQDSTECKVNWKNITGKYIGDCKQGLANGKGEAIGLQRYTGSFENGMPNGNGIYYYSDSLYHSGNFQDGLKEGKGETHYLRKAMPDSVVKGYWSGDEYRGKKYITYTFSTTQQFDLTEITPSGRSGNTVTIEIGTTSGAPNGARGSQGYVINLRDLISPNGCITKMTSKLASAFKSYATFELLEFPCKLFGTLSNNETFELELYKAANWKIRLFVNK